jgi:hypothetical protein
MVSRRDSLYLPIHLQVNIDIPEVSSFGTFGYWVSMQV